MSASSIHVSKGKVIGDSVFFLLANDLLSKESNRLCELTDALDKDPERKKERMAEYTCAKCRYAAVSLIHSIVFNNNRCRQLHNLEYSHCLLLPFDEIFKAQAEYLALYESAPANEKPDYSLYYAALAFTDKECREFEEKLSLATDWERVELKERIDGLQFAKECLNEAWQRRKGGIE